MDSDAALAVDERETATRSRDAVAPWTEQAIQRTGVEYFRERPKRPWIATPDGAHRRHHGRTA